MRIDNSYYQHDYKFPQLYCWELLDFPILKSQKTIHNLPLDFLFVQYIGR